MTDRELLRAVEVLLEEYDNMAADLQRDLVTPARQEAQKAIEELYRRIYEK